MNGQAAVPPPPPPGGPPAQKTSEIIGNLRPTKLFRLSKAETTATSLSFDDLGEFLLAACSDESLQLYNAKEGRHIKTLLSQKYGAHLARFTHHSQSIIYASTKGDDTIRYLSTHDNQFLRYFKGHTAPVTTLALCPAGDTFVSGSLDNTLRLWSLTSPNPQGRLNLATPTLATYDPSATVIAVASPSTASVLLYDVRNYDKAPFSTFDLREFDNLPHIANNPLLAPPRDWSKLEFSNDGKTLLVGTTNSAGHVLLDAFNGGIRAFVVRPPQHLPLNPAYLRAAPWSSGSHERSSLVSTIPGQGDVCFSADGKYLVGASGGDRDLVVWDIHGGGGGGIDADTYVLNPMCGLPCKSRAGVVEWNPRYNMLATADREVIFWLPDEHVGMRGP